MPRLKCNLICMYSLKIWAVVLRILLMNDYILCSGYMSPEYAMDGIFSVKSDVFSFGVLVLEIISGKKSRGIFGTEPLLNLLSYVSSFLFLSILVYFFMMTFEKILFFL